MRSFLSVTDLSTEELSGVLDRADELHDLWHERRMPQSLVGRRIALWFVGQGFRNRLAFELGARSMGADVSTVPGELGVQEPIEDVGHYLANWFDALVIRCRRHEELLRLARDAELPTINARTGYNHPCEIVGDLQFVRRERGSLDGLSVVFVGEITNLCRSWFEAACVLPINVFQIGPSDYLLPDADVAALNARAAGSVATAASLGCIDASVDLIYTDCWPRDGDAEAVREAFAAYRITREVVDAMGEGLFLPCPPVTRGEEVTAAALDAPVCRNYAAKEFLLHAQNALMELAFAE
jgi:ornithine carbamoyltransferase